MLLAIGYHLTEIPAKKGATLNNRDIIFDPFLAVCF